MGFIVVEIFLFPDERGSGTEWIRKFLNQLSEQ
jgi:hypothetical protein